MQHVVTALVSSGELSDLLDHIVKPFSTEVEVTSVFWLPRQPRQQKAMASSFFVFNVTLDSCFPNPAQTQRNAVQASNNSKLNM